jgi:DNA-binding NtrC family response regulator
MTMPEHQATASVLIVDGDIVSRHAIADYLRHCGHKVIEAANTDEARLALSEETLSIDVVICDVAAIGTGSAFELARWARQAQPDLEVRMAGGLDATVIAATELCETGPHLARPYEPQSVVDYIKRLRAAAAKG